MKYHKISIDSTIFCCWIEIVHIFTKTLIRKLLKYLNLALASKHHYYLHADHRKKGKENFKIHICRFSCVDQIESVKCSICLRSLKNKCFKEKKIMLDELDFQNYQKKLSHTYIYSECMSCMGHLLQEWHSIVHLQILS